MAGERTVKIKIVGENNAKGMFGDAEKDAGGLGKTLGNIGTIASGFVVGQALTSLPGLLSSVADQAVALEDNATKAGIVFGDQIGMVEDWAEANANAMGLTKSEAVTLAASMGDLLIPMGFTREEAAKMATETVGLSGALSEWSGGTVTAAEASDILTKAYLGETDGLKALGISISAAEIQQQLMKNGTDKLTGAALAQAKAIATQELIMAKSTDAQTAYAQGADETARKQAEASAAMKEAQEQLSVALLPAIRAGTLAFASMATILATQIVPNILAVVQAVAGALMPVLGPLVGFFKDNLVPVFAGLAAMVVTVLVPALIGWATTMWTTTIPALIAQNAAMLPVIAIALAIGVAVAALFVAWKTNFLGIQDITRAVIDFVLPYITAALDAIQSAFTTVWPIISGAVETAVGVIKTVIETVIGGIQAFLAAHGEEIKTILGAAWAQIQNVVETAIAIVQGVITAAVAIMQGDWSAAWDAIKGIVAAARDFVVETVNNLKDLAIAALGILADEGGKLAGKLADLVITGVTRLVTEGPPKVLELQVLALQYLGELALQGAAKAVEFVEGVITALIRLFVEGPGKIFEFVKAGVAELAKLAVQGAAEAAKLPGAVLSAVGSLGGILVQSGIDVVQGFINGILAKIPDVVGAAQAIFDAVPEGLREFLFGSPSQLMHQYGAWVAEGFAEGIESRIGDIVDASSAISDAIIEGATKDLNRVPELVGSMTDEVVLGIASTRGDIQGQLDLAILRGDDEETIQGYRNQLAAIDALIAAWAEATGQTVQSVFDSVANEESANAAVSRYEKFLGDLEGLASGETATKLGEDLANALSLQRIAEQAGDTDLAAFYAAQAESINADLVAVGELMGTPIVQGMTETMQADKVVAEWDKRLSDALAGPAFGEGLQATIDGLGTKIDFGILNGAPQEVIDAWQAEQAEVQKQADQYWQDVAYAAANGLLDEKTIKEYAKAGGAQFEGYLEALVGKDATKKMIGGVGKITDAALEELHKTFDGGEVGEDMIQSVIDGWLSGHIPMEDAMALLAKIPEDELYPIIEERGEEAWQAYQQALAEGSDPTVFKQNAQEIIDFLIAIGMSAEDAEAAVKGFGDTADNVAKSGVGWKSGPSGPVLPSGGSSGSGGKLSDFTSLGTGKVLNFDSPESRDAYLAEMGSAHRIDQQVGSQPGTRITNNIYIDGEPVAQSVNKVNTRNLATNMGPI